MNVRFKRCVEDAWVIVELRDFARCSLYLLQRTSLMSLLSFTTINSESKPQPH